VSHGVASHHAEVPHTNVLGILGSAADAISASRPGARSETMTTYINRLENLEKIGLSFPGVDRCFAVQAGRELRVVVRPEQIADEQRVVLARNIARKTDRLALHEYYKPTKTTSPSMISPCFQSARTLATLR